MMMMMMIVGWSGNPRKSSCFVDRQIWRRLPMAYLTNGVVKYVDIYEIYVDLLFEE